MEQLQQILMKIESLASTNQRRIEGVPKFIGVSKLRKNSWSLNFQNFKIKELFVGFRNSLKFQN